MTDFAHYVKRMVIDTSPASLPARGAVAGLAANELVVDELFAEVQEDDRGLVAPEFHAAPTNAGAATNIKDGDTIWLFSQLNSPWGTLPPALDARIEVADVRRLEKNGKALYRFGAAPGSRWFPLYSASALLRELHARRADGVRSPLMRNAGTAVGQALRFVRRLDDAEPLRAHADYLQSTPYDFVSYRLLDGTAQAFALVQRLLQEGRSVFWDRWSLPRRLAERRETLNDQALDAFIAHSLRRSGRVYGILSPRYAEPTSYSHRERILAEQLGLFVPHASQAPAT
jgi:hypothetical protein